MFDIGFWELVVVAVVGLIVIGPEKLPDVVRSALRTWRKLRLLFSDVRHDLERELDLSELKKLQDEVDLDRHIAKLNADILAAEANGKKMLSDLREEADLSAHYEPWSDDGEHDGFTPEAAEAEAATGEESPTLSLSKTPPNPVRNEEKS